MREREGKICTEKLVALELTVDEIESHEVIVSNANTFNDSEYWYWQTKRKIGRTGKKLRRKYFEEKLEEKTIEEKNSSKNWRKKYWNQTKYRRTLRAIVSVRRENGYAPYTIHRANESRTRCAPFVSNSSHSLIHQKWLNQLSESQFIPNGNNNEKCFSYGIISACRSDVECIQLSPTNERTKKRIYFDNCENGMFALQVPFLLNGTSKILYTH